VVTALIFSFRAFSTAAFMSRFISRFKENSEFLTRTAIRLSASDLVVAAVIFGGRAFGAAAFVG